MAIASGAWPPLPYEAWRETRDTLHMYTQVVGKLRLALSPFEPGWANVPLYVTARGLTTSPVPAGLRAFDAEFDLHDHVLVIRTNDGQVERRPLGGPVAAFYSDVMDALRRMGIDVEITVTPSEVPDPIPFPEDDMHHVYEPEQANRFHRALSIVDVVVKEHRARFRGRTSPVHFFWGTFDLALTRYSGNPAAPITDRGTIEAFGSDAEEICCGWWPGNDRVPFPAFYSYAYPAPHGIEGVSIQPDTASWDTNAGEFILPYDAAISDANPSKAILDFLSSSYSAAARLLGWSSELTSFATPPVHTSMTRTPRRST